MIQMGLLTTLHHWPQTKDEGAAHDDVGDGIFSTPAGDSAFGVAALTYYQCPSRRPARVFTFGGGIDNNNNRPAWGYQSETSAGGGGVFEIYIFIGSFTGIRGG